MVDLGERRHRALASAAAGALLDGDGGRYAEDRIDVGAGSGLDELPGIGIEGLEIAALSFGKQDVECQRALAAARDAGDDGELIAPQTDVDILEIVLARAANFDGLRRGGALPASPAPASCTAAPARQPARRRRSRERAPGMRGRYAHDLLRVCRRPPARRRHRRPRDPSR